MNPIIKKFQYGNQTVTLETGRVARQATGAVVVTMGETAVLCTVVGAKEASPGQDFFPLSVHYIEKAYAAGKIPGGFFKREGRPSEKETLTSRLIDRPIRPLFPEGFLNEVQVVCTVLSTDKVSDPDIAAMIGTSAALAISGIPFNGPIGGARVGYTTEQGYLLNPTYKELETSELDMVVAGTKDAVLMVESEAKELPEDIMLGAVLYAHQEMQVVIQACAELARDAGKPRWDWQAPVINADLKAAVEKHFADSIGVAYRITDKAKRYDRLAELRNQAVAELVNEEAGVSADDVKDMFGRVESNIVRSRIVAGEPRIDGRDNKTVRPIEVEVGVLPRVHGSALFTRGETQALVVATLGNARDVQVIDALEGERKDPFMLHYNFPPYSVGECGRMGATGRREIGHGRLARRGVAAVLPAQDSFPYTLRVVSEITESNGSSSMASVCGSSLALMDAGVPLKAPVAGIAMGLVKEDNGFAVLTDILGDEDHLGDMDFKVTGTEKGVVGCQMDLKINGLKWEVLTEALEQARVARLHILNEMKKAIAEPRTDYKPHAPRIVSFTIDKEFIGAVIGPGGKIIQEMQRETGATIAIDEVDNKGVVQVFAESKASIDDAVRRIKAIAAKPEVGEIYEGKVKSIMPFGAFIEIIPGKDGLLHISEIDWKRFETMDGIFNVGDIVRVKLLDIDKQGKLKLSRKVLIPRPEKKEA